MSRTIFSNINNKHVIFFILCFLLISCRKDEPSDSSTSCNLYYYSDLRLKTHICYYSSLSSNSYEFFYNNSGNVEEIKSTFITTSQDTNITRFLFEYTQSSITGFTKYHYYNQQGDTTTGSLTFSGGLIQKVDIDPDDNNWDEYQYDANKKVIRVAKVFNGEEQTYSSFKYNIDCNISEENYNGNILRYDNYDLKKNPYRSLKLPEAIIYSLQLGWPFSQNNILSSNFSYKYNSNDFPDTLDLLNGQMEYFNYETY